MIYENLDSEVLPAENVIELVPFVLLLLQEQHRVHVPVYLEVLMVAQPSEQYRLISFYWIFGLPDPCDCHRYLF